MESTPGPIASIAECGNIDFAVACKERSKFDKSNFADYGAGSQVAEFDSHMRVLFWISVYEELL